MSLAALLHVLNHSKALQSDQLILLRLADHATEHGLAWPARTTLARETGYTRQLVHRALLRLMQLGEIREVWSAGGQRRWELPVYNSTTKACTCHFTLQAPESDCNFNPPSVTGEACKSSARNGNAAEPLEDEPEKTGAHAPEETERPPGRPQDVDPTYEVDLKAIVARLKF
jgi:hypothetical protein